MNIRLSLLGSTLLTSFYLARAASAEDAPAPTPLPNAAALLATEKPLEPGATAPDFTAATSEGKPVHLSDYKDKVVVLDFWASWCAPCQQSLPRTDRVARDFPEVVFLALDTWDPLPAFKQWLARHPDLKQLSFATDPSKGGWQIAHLYGVNGIPCQYVIARDGRIAARLVEQSEGDPPRVLRTLAN